MCFCRSNAFFFKVYGVTIWASKETECINISRAQIKEIRIPTIWIPTTKIIFNLLMFSQWLRSAGSATIKDHSPPLTPSITVVKREMSRPMTKPTTWHVRPANTQISLGIRPVWSESSLCAWRNLEFLATHWAHSEDSDQAGRMPRLICLRWAHMSFCWFCHAAAQITTTGLAQRSASSREVTDRTRLTLNHQIRETVLWPFTAVW